MTKATILNTRPVDLQKITHDAFSQYAFNVVNFPCIEINSVENRKQVYQQLSDINANDIVIFTSQYAVRFAYNINPNLSFTNETIVICVGTKTAEVLEQYFPGDIWIPKQQKAKGVINLLKGLAQCQSIKLISANNGRDLIQNYALKNDINFVQINVYKRQLPLTPNNIIEKLYQTHNNILILATSQTTLIHLKALASESWDFLLTQTVVCASKRIALKANDMGFTKTVNLRTAEPNLMAEKLNTAMYH